MNNNQTNIATALATATGTVQTLERHANNSCSNCCNSGSNTSNCSSSSSSNTNNATYYYQRRLQHLLLLALLVCVASFNSCWLQPVQARRHAPLMFEEADTARRSNRPAGKSLYITIVPPHIVKNVQLSSHPFDLCHLALRIRPVRQLAIKIWHFFFGFSAGQQVV